MVVVKADDVLTYSGHRAIRITRMTWRQDDLAHRSTSFMSVHDCELMAAHGVPVPISADATTRWVKECDDKIFLHDRP